MENELKLLGEAIIEAKTTIAKKVHGIRLKDVTPQQLEQLKRDQLVGLKEEDIISIRADFVKLFGEFLCNHDRIDVAYKAIEDWGKKTGEYVHNLGVPLDEAMKDTSYYRTFINEIIEEKVKQHNMSVNTVFEAYRILNPLLDHAVYCFSLTYVNFYKKTLENAKNAFIEVSIPVVPLSKGIAVLPLVGNVDTERAALLMEETLKEASRLNLSHLILDLSGVLIVDTMVAHQIFNVMDALKLLGIKTIITGIRPEIAQTVVSLGLDFSKQVTRANLQQALTDVELFKKS